MKTYRLTRPGLYSHDCSGRDDLAARQGHYYEADTIAAVVVEASADFPGDGAFDIQRVDDNGNATPARRMESMTS